MDPNIALVLQLARKHISHLFPPGLMEEMEGEFDAAG